MYTTESVVGCTRILPFSMLQTHPLILKGVKKCKIWPRSSTPLFFERPSFRNEATHNYQSIIFGLVQRWWNSVLPKSGAAWPTPLMSRVWKSTLHWKKLAKSSITHPRIDRSQSNLVHSLITWHPTYHTFSRLRGQRSKSQRDTTVAKFAKLSITQQRIVQFLSLIHIWRCRRRG